MCVEPACRDTSDVNSCELTHKGLCVQPLGRDSDLSAAGPAAQPIPPWLHRVRRLVRTALEPARWVGLNTILIYLVGPAGGALLRRAISWLCVAG